MEIPKFEYLEKEKSFLDEIKNVFHSFWRAIIWWKIKISAKWRTQALNNKIATSFESGLYTSMILIDLQKAFDYCKPQYFTRENRVCRIIWRNNKMV